MYFSICIPTYNRKHTLFRTLDSIVSQSFESYEVLIVDDGSTDGTQQAVEEYITANNLRDKFRYFYKNNGGKHTAVNVGIENATGEFFVIFDSDDWFADDALLAMYKQCEKIKNDDSFSGIMGRSVDVTTGEMIGDRFEHDDIVSSYFEYHFILPFKMNIHDCLEANKTKIIKQYRFPEPANTKFVNEAWLFDQIGVKYKMLLSNDRLRFVEYQEGGLSSNPIDYKRKNIVGYLYHYISRIENVLPLVPLSGISKLKFTTIAWWRYWEAVRMDHDCKGPRITKVSAFGMIIKIIEPLISKMFEIKVKKNNYRF